MTPEEMREARKNAGLSQRQLATLLGAAQITVHSWETGKRPINRITEIAVLAVVKELAK